MSKLQLFQIDLQDTLHNKISLKLSIKDIHQSKLYNL